MNTCIEDHTLSSYSPNPYIVRHTQAQSIHKIYITYHTQNHSPWSPSTPWRHPHCFLALPLPLAPRASVPGVYWSGARHRLRARGCDICMEGVSGIWDSPISSAWSPASSLPLADKVDLVDSDDVWAPDYAPWREEEPWPALVSYRCVDGPCTFVPVIDLQPQRVAAWRSLRASRWRSMLDWWIISSY